ncbi:hypothetical protein [Micromonospora sp. NPDC092111]|uniref:hypothetical protein n=1 Tax=Micromonospora sp. NPDC092111 TaxID=3364289 RepID=UPI003805E7CB
MAVVGRPAKKTPSKGVAWAGWLTLGLVVVGFLVAGALGDSDGTAVSPPATTERADTVPILQRSSASQGICYGWRLDDDHDTVSVGSNLGDGVPVEDNPGCPRWVQVTADVTYTSESSESDDYASVRVTASEDVSLSDAFAIESGLERLGITERVFVDDPGWGVTRAAVMLPLLAVEVGLAGPAATPTPEPAGPGPLPDAGSDLWRDRWVYFAAAAGLLLVTALLITVGVVQRRRQRRGTGSARRAGAGAASSRTGETA